MSISEIYERYQRTLHLPDSEARTAELFALIGDLIEELKYHYERTT